MRHLLKKRNYIGLFIHRLIQECFGKRMEVYPHQRLRTQKDCQLSEKISVQVK